MCMFIVWYPLEFSRLRNLHPWYWNSLLYGLIYSGENSAHFLQLPFTVIHFCSTRYLVDSGFLGSFNGCQIWIYIHNVMWFNYLSWYYFSPHQHDAWTSSPPTWMALSWKRWPISRYRSLSSWYVALRVGWRMPPIVSDPGPQSAKTSGWP